MGKRLEEALCKRGYPKGDEQETAPSFISHQRKGNENHSTILPHTHRMANMNMQKMPSADEDTAQRKLLAKGVEPHGKTVP